MAEASKVPASMLKRVEKMKEQYEKRIETQRDSIDRLLVHLGIAHGQFDHDCPGCPKGDTGE
jgi:hypothetical protein